MQELIPAVAYHKRSCASGAFRLREWSESTDKPANQQKPATALPSSEGLGSGNPNSDASWHLVPPCSELQLTELALG